MCGITGFFAGGEPPADGGAALGAMAARLVHRGPDDVGLWQDRSAGIGLGHRRLSILDLSSAGHQPMVSASGRFVAVLNGEIYNFEDLRSQLADYPFRGGSDTEVVLAATEAWGVQTTVRRLSGMFAIAIWDRRERILYLARDRFGEKPLYFSWYRGTLIFGSELKAIQAYPGWVGTVSYGALSLLLRFAYIPGPHTIFEEAHKLLPGRMLIVQRGTDGVLSGAEEEYWSLADLVKAGEDDPFHGSEEEAATELERLLQRSVRRQMVADVPVGAFFSGGIDSSTVVALMQAQSNRPIRTFTIGYREPGCSEAGWARPVADHLKTDHTEWLVGPEQALSVIPRLPEMYDEPFADASQIPTHLVAALARQSVTVSLSGDGGDEIFGGYNRHVYGNRIWSKLRLCPAALRRPIARLLHAAARPWLNGRPARAGRAGLFNHMALAEKLQKIGNIFPATSTLEVYRILASQWQSPQRVLLSASEPLSLLDSVGPWSAMRDFTRQMMYLDTVTYLADDILVKVDRACMAVGLESRAPLLDPAVAAFAWRLPLAMNVRDGQGKRILRQVLGRYVPLELVDRPKAGFGLPLDVWLRGSLRPWAEELLDERQLAKEGFFQPGPIRQVWAEHLSGRVNRQCQLWPVLMFQSWWRYNRFRGAAGHSITGAEIAGLTRPQACKVC